MINKVIEINAKPACDIILFNLLESMIEPSRAESGCNRYDVYRDVKNAGRFLLFESWESDRDLEAHRQSDHMQIFKQKAPDLIADKQSFAV